MFSLLTVLLLSATATVLTPDAAVQAALTNDPALAAREAEVETATGLRRQSGFLIHNPEISGAADRTGVTIGIVQPLSVTGEGTLAAQSAQANLDAATSAAERARFETAASTRRAYARAVLARELLRLAEEDRTLLERLRGVAEARAAAGSGIDLDLRLARLEQARAVAAWLDAQAQASESDAELAALIGRTPDELAHDPLVACSAPSNEGTPRSDLIATRAATRAARATLARERAAVFPELGLGAFYQRDTGTDIFGLTASMELPVWRRNESGIGAARGNLRLAEALETSTLARASTEESRAEERLRVAEESLKVLAPDIRAEASPALQAIEKLFAAGESNLSDTLLLRSRVIEGERAWMEARAAIAVARTDVALARQSKSLLP